MSLYAHLFSSPCLESLGIQGFGSNFLKTFPLPVMFASVDRVSYLSGDLAYNESTFPENIRPCV